MDVNGVLWTVTNAPPVVGKYVMGFNPANSTAWYATELTIGTTPGTAYDAGSGVAVSNLAAGALPALSTNALAVAALQVTGGSPTNGAVLVATNGAGQGKWMVYPKIFARKTTTVNSGLSTFLTFDTVDQQIGGVWDGTNWTPGVVGWMTINVAYKWGAAAYDSLSRLSLYKNSVMMGWGIQHPINQTGGSFGQTWCINNDNVTNKWTVFLDTPVANTNSTDAYTCFFAGSISP
jgi:hypothetical protein